MPATTAETLSLVSRNVTVAPLVLLSVVDHYNRTEAFKSKTKRVVGVLLGHNDGDNVRVSNSFAGEQHTVPSKMPLSPTDAAAQCPSKKTRGTRRFGSWTITTSSR